ncbi:unnamed protein product (macronuclear) [Paramecium tetraurelia]|uniref:Uncharacterized protein n=1 Tax=Paramecium tetraurelia TaxID=5888 RepID=A0CEL9_PARTE|nr:uncharacterized protein GSPATT00037674001 [Paramecium tetraurelia]CAK69236.1 unnamed protein product [Paramecium tetraurelia]|eukprot:XP_001436633.1 hypothetical protein (macronuclear) [Paramecium tetraurelia strain d4-2]
MGAIVEKAVAKLDPKDSRLSMIQAMLSTFGEEINLSRFGLRQLDGTPINIPYNINFKEQRNILEQTQYVAKKTEVLGKHLQDSLKFKKKYLLYKNFFQIQFLVGKKNNLQQVQNQIRIIQKYFRQKQINLLNIPYRKIEEELVLELQIAGRLICINENGVLPSQSPLLFTPMQFSNNKRCMHFMRWNELVNIQREFIDQLKEIYEIGKLKKKVYINIWSGQQSQGRVQHPGGYFSQCIRTYIIFQNKKNQERELKKSYVYIKSKQNFLLKNINNEDNQELSTLLILNKICFRFNLSLINQTSNKMITI